jgi:hypothetical protein
VDCQRRFQLRHLLHRAWPAVEAEPYLENERRIDQGAQFHKIVHQFLLGIPEGQIDQTIGGDETMQGWWDNFLASIKSGNLKMLIEEGNQRFEEITLSVPIEKFRLVAKYDLIILHQDGKVTIVDWKTSENHPKRKWLADRLQTRVYPFVFVGALPGLLRGATVDPAHVEMLYWFTNQPDQPEMFSYDQQHYQEDLRFLANLISTIDQKPEVTFPLTPDMRHCLFCTYRSLCNRGVKPGDLQQLEQMQEPMSAEEVSLDFDQIREVEL